MAESRCGSTGVNKGRQHTGGNKEPHRGGQHPWPSWWCLSPRHGKRRGCVIINRARFTLDTEMSRSGPFGADVN